MGCCQIHACGPNEAFVLSGCCHRKPRLVHGGRIFVRKPGQIVRKINLNVMTILVDSRKVYTSKGVPISVTGVAQVKVQSQNKDMLLTACELFLSKSTEEIRNIALETLEGHQRAIMGSMTVEEIYKDRKKFSQQVFEVASSDLVNMGLTVISYTIKDVVDVVGYLKYLGTPRTESVKRDARIGEAQYGAEAKILKAHADEELMAAKYYNQTEIAKAKRDFELKKAEFDVEVNTVQAEADLAFELQVAKIRQKIVEEERQIDNIEKAQEILLMEQEIARQEQILEATVRRPAEAEKYELEILAEADHQRIRLEAEGAAESIRLKGEAEAYAIIAKANAEAEQMEKKADAFKMYAEAAMVDMLLETLPRAAAEVAAPLAQTNKITMIASGSGEVGAAKITGEVFDIIERIPELIKSLTGVEISMRRGRSPSRPQQVTQ